MSESLFGLTLIFIVYVLYEVFKTISSAKGQSSIKTVEPVEAVAPAVAPKVAEPVEAVNETPVAVKAEVIKPTEAPAEKTIMLRNPENGETSVPPTNYRFAKKWIKEALVTEGLLKKIYKNSELTENVNASVKQALEQFKHIEKYQA